MIRLLLLLSFLLYSCSSTTTEYRSAKTYVGQQNYDKAEEIALQGIANNPEDALTPYYLALNIYGAPNSLKKDYSKTAQYFTLAIEIDDKTDDNQLLPDPIPVLNQYEETIQLVTIKEAITHYRYMIWAEIFNESIELINKSDNKGAIEKLKVGKSMDPNNPATYDMLARLFFEMNDFNQSLNYANQALELDNSISDLFTLKAEISKSEGDNIKAEEYLRKAYKIAISNNEDPKKLTNHMAALFDILFVNGKKTEALGLSESLIEKDPENVLLYSNAGALYQNILIDEMTKANELLSKIMDLNEQQLEDLKVIYQDCIDLANKARENFLMCNQFELDEEKSESYYKEAKRLKQIINEVKSYIKKVDKKIDEL